MSSSDSYILRLSKARAAQHAMLHPRSNKEVPTRFMDPYPNFQMPPHFDQANPETWPEDYAKRQFDLGVHPYIRHPPNPNQTHGDAHAPGLAYYSGRVDIPPVYGREESSTSARRRGAATGIPDSKGSVIPLGLSNYIRVPQEVFVGPVGAILQPIEFKSISNEPGIDVDKARASHKIENSEDKVFNQLPVTDNIVIKIMWPGYLRYPYEARIRNARNLSRSELLDRVCRMVIEFAQVLRASRIVVDKKHAEWMIGKTGLRMEGFYIARLHHRGGNYFQPEILSLPRQRR